MRNGRPLVQAHGLGLDSAAVTVELGSREYSRVTVPVKSVCGAGKGYYCGEEISHLGEFLLLWTSLGGKVELRGDVNADVLQLLLENVTRPLQKKCTVCDHFLPPGMVSGCHLIKGGGKEIPCFGPEEAATAKGEAAPVADATRPKPTDGEVHAARIFDCMRWVCQEARAAVMADNLGKGRLRPALKALADAYEGK